MSTKGYDRDLTSGLEPPEQVLGLLLTNTAELCRGGGVTRVDIAGSVAQSEGRSRND